MKSFKVLSTLLLLSLAYAVRFTVAEPSRPLRDLSAASADAAQSAQSAQSASMVDTINALDGIGWKAGLSEYFADKSMAFLKASLGLKLDRRHQRPLDNVGIAASSAPVGLTVPDPFNPLSPFPWDPPSNSPTNGADPLANPAAASDALPAHFDCREKWGHICPSLYEIRDQSGCGSCWAVSAASSITDRICIASNGTVRPEISASDILSCCGTDQCGSCAGGYPIEAWNYWTTSGIVTGGPYPGRTNSTRAPSSNSTIPSSTTCMPYDWAPCEHHTKGSRPQCKAQDQTPACSAACTAPGYPKSYSDDKHLGSSSYSVDSDEAKIRQEIFLNGPVEAGFMVYADFPIYRSGVYHHTDAGGSVLGGHAVKIIGWGEEKGLKYWTVANSWNTDWGDHGFFKILRGTDECSIEEMIVAGLPSQPQA
jgi:cathepsin B